MSHVTYSNHFSTRFFTCGLGATAVRGQDNPCYGIGLDEFVPSKYKRLDIFIQNQGTGEVLLGFGDDNGLTMKLFAGQSINFDNYNGPVEISDTSSVFVMETFA